jgi:hypothetical protein
MHSSAMYARHWVRMPEHPSCNETRGALTLPGDGDYGCPECPTSVAVLVCERCGYTEHVPIPE